MQSLEDRCVFVSPNCERICGWQAEELHGSPLRAFAHEEDANALAETRLRLLDEIECRAQFRLRHKDGRFPWVEARARLSDDGQYIVLTIRDIDEQLQLIRDLQRLALSDPLTDVLNRRALDEALAAEMNRSRRLRKELTAAFFDVDHFKLINDRHGHAAGDRILKNLSECVRQAKRNYDRLGRWGGDEFLLIFPETTLDSAIEVIERIRNQVQQDMPGVTLSFGLSANTYAASIDGLLLQADTALYRSKRSGGNRVSCWHCGI